MAKLKKSEEAMSADEIREATAALIERDGAMQEAAEQREVFPGCGYSYRDVYMRMPKPTLEELVNTELPPEKMIEQFVEKMKPMALAKLMLDFAAGERSATTVVGKLVTDPFMAKARAIMLSQPPGGPKRALAVEAPVGSVGGIADALLRSGGALPESSKQGIQMLQEILQSEDQSNG